jgi:transcriptional regulator with PAS, ATPase and Fis domain
MELEKIGLKAIERLWGLLQEELHPEEAGLFLQDGGKRWRSIFASSEKLKSWFPEGENIIARSFPPAPGPKTFLLSDGNCLVLSFLHPCRPGLLILLREKEAFKDWELKLAEKMAGPIGYILGWLESSRSGAGQSKNQEAEEPVLKELIIGESEATRNLRQTIARLRSSDAPVLIVGESGTGKELVARAIHSTSHRRQAAMVVINCGAIPEHLLESELFGYARGAFTGAQRDKPGLVEEANGGTLFLDEIGDLAFPLQAKLLRLIQEKEFRRVGETKVRRSNVRFLSATNRNLEEEIKEGRFREDLYYRLKIITLEIPPLRERKEDLMLLVDHFLRFYGRQLGKPHVLISPAALERLLAYDWPGNIRELQNEIQRSLILCGSEGVIEEKDLSPRLFPPQDKPVSRPENFFVARAEFERRFLRTALARYGYNRTRAAGGLGLSRQGLTKLLKKYRLLEKNNSRPSFVQTDER